MLALAVLIGFAVSRVITAIYRGRADLRRAEALVLWAGRCDPKAKFPSDAGFPSPRT